MAAYQDLLKDTSISLDNGNYFLITITDLDLNQSYPLQFRWKYKDGTYGLWSGSKTIVTPGETLPGRPNLATSDLVGGKGFISVTWNGNDSAGKPITNIDRVDIYIDGGVFDATKPAASFKAAGTQTIAAAAGQYAVTLYAVTNYGGVSPVSLSRIVKVLPTTQEIINPENPSAPKATAGLASVIVEWDGKKNNGDGTFVNFSAGSFAGAKVFIGTTSDFTPSDNNWVNTLNFANGVNKVSIGVGTVINKTDNIKLQYGVPYYVKIDTVNADNTANGHPVSAIGNPVTVDKLPASEIKTGFLSADAQILAGISGGARVELSGSTTPFVIYGSGSQELLKFTSSPTPSLIVNGGGTFTGSLSIGSSNDIFKAEPLTGIWLGNEKFDDANFSVSKTGYLTAKAGVIAGWSLNGNSLQNSLGTFQIDSSNSRIILGSPDYSHITISPSSITHYDGPGAPSNKFTLTTSNGNLKLSGEITGSKIYGSTITSASSDSGRKIVLDPTTNSLSFYNEGTHGVAHIVPMGTSGSQYQGIIIHSGDTAVNVGSSLPLNSFPLIAMNRLTVSDNTGNITFKVAQYNGLSVTSIDYLGELYTGISISGSTIVDDNISWDSVRPIAALSATYVGSSSPTAASMNSQSKLNGSEGLIALVYS
jgi:hypothetical protein